MLEILRMQYKDILFLVKTPHRGKSLLQLQTFDLWLLIIFFLSIEMCVFSILLNSPNPLDERERHGLCALTPGLSSLLSLALVPFLQIAAEWALNTSSVGPRISRLCEAPVPLCYLQSSEEQRSRLIVLQSIIQPP